MKPTILNQVTTTDAPKHRLIKNVSNDTWRLLKMIAVSRDLRLHEALSLVIKKFFEDSYGNNDNDAA